MQLSVKSVAELLSVTEKTVYRWIQNQQLPAYRVQGHYRVNRAMLFEWATARKVNISPALFHEHPSEAPAPSLEGALRQGGIFYRVEGTTRDAILRAAVDLLRLPDHTDREVLYQALLARERLQSTGLGDGIAAPHARNPMIVEVDRPMVCLCYLAQPVDFRALDGRPVSILFTLVTPSVRDHLRLLSHLSFCLRDPVFKKTLIKQAGREDLLAAIRRVESALPQTPERRR